MSPIKNNPSTSTPTPSSSGSSSALTGGTGSYNPSTKTYTSPSGQKQSRSYSNVPTGTAIDLSGGGSSRGSSGGGSSNLGQPITTVPRTNTPGYIGSKPSTDERGVLTVTPDQASALKNQGVPYWVQQSKSPAEAVSEGNFVGGVSQINRALPTKNLYLYNQRNVLAGQETYRQYNKIVTDFKSDPSSFEGQTGVTSQTNKYGISYQLSPDYFEKNINSSDIYKNSLSQAKVDFNSLPKDTRNKMKFWGFGLSATSQVLGFAEFGGTMIANMGYATSDESGKFQKRSVKFGGTLGNIRTYPSIQTSGTFLENPYKYTKEKVLTPEFGGAAAVIVPTVIYGAYSTVSNFKNLGFKAGAVETLSGVAPFKLKPGIYSQPITAETKFSNVKSLKYTDKAGITTRVYSGSSGNIKLTGYEKSALVDGQSVGGGFSLTKTPFIEIKSGGAYVTTGTRTTLNPYAFGGAGSGKAYLGSGNNFYTQVLSPSIKGGTSNIVSSRGVTYYTTQEGSTVFNNLNKGVKFTGGTGSKNTQEGVKVFVSGKSRSIYEYKSYKPSSDFIYKPTGRYRFNPQVGGTEYDLNVLMNKGGSNGYTSFQGGGSSGSGVKLDLKTGTGAKAVMPTTTAIKTPATTTLIPAVNSPFTTKKTKTAYSPTTTTVQTSKTNIRTGQNTINVLIPEVRSRSRSRSRSTTTTIQLPQQKPITQQKPKQETATIPRVIQVKKVKIQQAQQYATINPFTFGGGGSSYNPYSAPIPKPIPLPLGIGGGMGMGIGNVKPRRSPKAYTPSFTALYFKIKGKAPKGVATGIRFRPITKGFSFQSKKKIIKVRKIKI